LPVPSLAEDIKARQAQTPHPEVRIERIKFVGNITLPASALEELANSLRTRSFDADSDWMQEAVDIHAREVWQRYGYYNVVVNGESRLLNDDKDHQRVSVTIHVTEGPQYRLAYIRFEHADVFPPQELRKLIPLDDGEVFDVLRIRQGLDALKKLYGTKGYIDFTASPLTEVDERGRRIKLTLDLDEDTQYRVGKITVLGLAPKTEAALVWRLKPGEVFDYKFYLDFFEDNKSLLPPDANPQLDSHISRDARAATVDIIVDFRGCPVENGRP